MAEIINPLTTLVECPFCHKPGFLFRDPLWRDGHGYYGNYEYFVGCDNDECNVKPKTRVTNDIYGKKEEAIQEAIRKWNSR